MIDLSIVDLEFESNEIGEDSCGACLGLDRNNLLAWGGPNDWKTVRSWNQHQLDID